jgi:hypothetical protein
MVNKLVLINTPEKGTFDRQFLPYVSIIYPLNNFRFCITWLNMFDNPPVTPALIKNGVIPSII